MRAIAVCLPDKFELDNDGKKAEWRARFMTRVKQLVGQFNGDMVKGGWERKYNRRSMVKLPPLKPEQLRRPIYYYRTKEQCDARLKQYDDKQALLDKKTVWLSNARVAVDEAKREYDVILNEMRDPELKAAYGVEQFTMAKDLAKQEYIEADKKRKNLEKEVIQLKATIASSPMSREQFYASMVELENFLAERDIDWNQSNLPPVLIEGVFDPFPEIKRVERCNAKFLSAEEEAEIRKQELLSLKSKQTSNSNDDITNNVVENIESVDNTNENKDNTLSKDKPNQLNKIYPMPIDNDSNILLSPSVIRKRNSVLDTANPDMINILNNIFSPGKSQLVIRRGASMLSPGSIHRQTMSGNITTSSTISKNNINIDIINEEKKEIKTTRSKLLQRLLGKSSKPTTTESSSNKPNLSFLDQIKIKMNNDNSDELIDKPKMSFLDQLKKRMNNTNDNDSGNSDEPVDKPQISFLDQIKKRKNPLEEENLSNSKPKMSFLDQIKARSRVNDCDKENVTNNNL